MLFPDISEASVHTYLEFERLNGKAAAAQLRRKLALHVATGGTLDDPQAKAVARVLEQIEKQEAK
jgi:hypothetical protein